MREKMNPWWMGVFVVCVAAVATPALAQEVTQASPLAGQQAPEYPPAAMAVRFSGVVTLAAHVDASGAVSEVQVVDCTHPKVGFEEAAVAAIEQWEFEPARVDGEAVSSVVLYRMGFDTPERGESRDLPGTTGQMMAAALAAPWMTALQATEAFGAEYSTQSSRRRLVLTTPKLPPSCLGCLYDRSDLLPAQSRGRQFGPK